MLRLPRRLAVMLLWAALALLPLRGVATALMTAATMPAGTATQDIAATAMAHADADALSAMPCHGASATAADDIDDPSDMAGDCPSCSLCALCHGGVAHGPQVSLALAVLHGERPAAVPGPARAARAPDALFRPPRPPLA